MCACGSTWPIALDLLQMLQRQRRGFFFGDILTGLLLQLQIQKPFGWWSCWVFVIMRFFLLMVSFWDIFFDTKLGSRCITTWPWGKPWLERWLFQVAHPKGLCLWMKFRPRNRNGHMVGVLMPKVAFLVNGVPSNPLVHLWFYQCSHQQSHSCSLMEEHFSNPRMDDRRENIQWKKVFFVFFTAQLLVWLSLVGLLLCAKSVWKKQLFW